MAGTGVSAIVTRLFRGLVQTAEELVRGLWGEAGHGERG